MKRKVAVSETQSVGPRLTQTQLYREFNYFPHPKTAEINAVITKKEFVDVQSRVAIVFNPSPEQDGSTLRYVFDNMQTLRDELGRKYGEEKLRKWASSPILHATDQKNELAFGNFEFLKIVNDTLSDREEQLKCASYALHQYAARKYSESYFDIENFLKSEAEKKDPSWPRLDTAAKKLDYVVSLQERFFEFVSKPEILTEGKPNSLVISESVRQALTEVNEIIMLSGKYRLEELIGRAQSEQKFWTSHSVAALSAGLQKHLMEADSSGNPRIVSQAKFWNDCFFAPWEIHNWQSHPLTWDANHNGSKLMFDLLGNQVPSKLTKDSLRKLVTRMDWVADYFIDVPPKYWGKRSEDQRYITSIRMMSLLAFLNNIVTENPEAKSWIREIVLSKKESQVGILIQFLSGSLSKKLDVEDSVTSEAFKIRGQLLPENDSKSGFDHKFGEATRSNRKVSAPVSVDPYQSYGTKVRTNKKKDDESKQTTPEFPMRTSRIYFKKTTSARLQYFIKSNSSKFIGKTRYFLSQLFCLSQTRTN